MSFIRPTCRATIRGGRVTLNPWTPWLLGHGPVPAGFSTVDAALADLRTLDEDELIVTPVPHVPWTPAAEDALLAWAALVGRRRVWLPSRVVDLGDTLPAVVPAAAECPTCAARWEDDTLPFWESVRCDGWFPGTCLACGGSLPEWSAVRSTSAGATP